LPGSGRVTATPLWFGPSERPLFGWLHLPEGGVVRGGVVLCQPLGIEAICVYFSYRLLAERLAGLGLAVLRFDYDGTGDSSGRETDPDRLDAWLDSVTAATDVMDGTGVGAIGLVGIRVGGLFAAHEAARRGGVAALVLWDPTLSGKAFLREQKFLRTLGLGEDGASDASIEAPGIRFEAETVKELADLELASMEGPLADRTLVLVPPGRSRPRGLTRRLEGLPVEWQEATGQDLLLDSHLQEPPVDTIGRITDWLVGAVCAEPTTVARPADGSVAVERPPLGEPVIERPISLGPLGLFGIVTEAEVASTTPTIVLVNEGNTHHIGQARIWVDLARRLASEGFRVLRFDLSGNGDSGTRPGQPAHVARAPEATDDVNQAVGTISAKDPADVVLIGFCSGAYQIAEQAMDLRPRGVCVINPFFSFVPPEPVGTQPRPARQATKPWFVHLVRTPLKLAARRVGPEERDRWLNALDIGTWPVAFATRWPSVPSPVWRLVNRFLLDNPGVATLEHIVEAGVDTLLVCGPGDLLPVSLGAEHRVQQLEASDHFRLVVLDDLDHSSWKMSDRNHMIEVLSGYLLDRYRPAPAARPSDRTDHRSQ
jgi:alpha-beta hydrolase superfamily lysophospholipase